MRRRFARLVGRFRRRLADAGLHAAGGPFPVQTLRIAPGVDAAGLHDRLLQQGVRTVLGRAGRRGRARIRFLINARHRGQDIDRAVDALSLAVDRFTARPMTLGAYHESII